MRLKGSLRLGVGCNERWSGGVDIQPGVSGEEVRRRGALLRRAQEPHD